MERPTEILGEIVQDLRSRRLGGMSISQLVRHFHSQGMSVFAINQHFREAFALSHMANLNMLPKGEDGLPQDELLEGLIAEQVNANLEQWQAAPPYPDLMRRRDREAFRQVAQRTGSVLIVCAADRVAGQREYLLHGVYKHGNGVNAWTAGEGEKIRAELNRRLGEELVRSGPLDNWEQRLELEEGDPRRAPRPPVLFFMPDGTVQARVDVKGMELLYRFLKIDWDAIYPSDAAAAEEAS
jgi:hypothetical protein